MARYVLFSFTVQGESLALERDPEYGLKFSGIVVREVDDLVET